MSQICKGCSHPNRMFLVIYNTGESTKLLCKNCYDDPDFVNDSIVDIVFNIETGDTIR